mmetsp:Transcript_39812/g.76277  ORF Transcript_39812/g.76277 Transcript_39812/m.76277 type:complete len:166 (-) Transcript_39812:317-814(-)
MCTLIPSCASRALMLQLHEECQQRQLQQKPPSSLPLIKPCAEVGEQHLCWGAAVALGLGRQLLHQKREDECSHTPSSGIDVRSVAFAVWAKVLNLSLDFVDLEDNFFDSGGHWALAVEIAEELSRSYGLPASAQDLCSTSTLSDFIDVLIKSQRCSAREDELGDI